ncbi:hypothetical protein ACFVU2_03190 [Leifsonia sp. NPDC058194]|uniref:hypothetical protein n=1 Tax=Leifsonia sp. NPDC058194 TaxID=3346374 RepID=UPI0036DC0377
MTQQARDRTFLPTTQTVLADAITQLGAAEQAASGIEPAGVTETNQQRRTLAAIRSALDAVLAAQRAVQTDAPSAVTSLRSSTEDLATLSDQLQKAEAGE